MASVVDVLPGTSVPFITTASAPISVAPAESAWPEVCTDDDTEPLLAASDATPVAVSRPYMGDLDEMDALGDDLSPTPDPVQIEPIHFELPDLSLLAPVVSPAAITQEHLSSAAVIEETLADHGVEVSVSEIRPGPSVTMFGLVPGWNRKAMSARARALAEQEAREVQLEVRNRVKVDSILAREKDLALALAAPSLRIQAPVPGESIVGVEVPNKSSSMVTIRTVMESPEYNKMVADGGLPVALGLASAGEPVVIDLTKMPHLLIAGATGSGKSVCINTIISSIITHQDPAKVRMVLVDPKLRRTDALQRHPSPRHASGGRSWQGGAPASGSDRRDDAPLQAAGRGRSAEHPLLPPERAHGREDAVFRHLHRRACPT